MSNRTNLKESDSRHHLLKIKDMLGGVIEHAREDVEKVTDAKAQALFETTAEVLEGLVHAYDHAMAKTEAAWR